MKFVLEARERAIFKKPLGTIYKSVQKMPLSNSKPIITVGDSSTSQLMGYWTKPILSVIDFKTKRTLPGVDLKPTITVPNPAGQITDELWHAIRDTKSGVIAVQGEEDLAVVPAVLLSKPGTQVVYGQPDEGLVLVEVSEKSKQKFGEILFPWLIRQGKAFLDKIQPGASVLIIHHTDADGCCAGAIIYKYLAKKGIKNISTASPSFSPRIGEKTQKALTRGPPDYLIVVDLGCESADFLSGLSNTTPVLVVDHHCIRDQSFGNSTLVNPCNLDLPTSFNPSATYLCHKIAEESDWLAVIGTYGDKGESKIQGLSKQVQEKYGITEEEILRAAHLIDCAESVEQGGAQKAISALIESNTFSDILEHPELNKFAGKIQSEIDKTFASYQENVIIDDSLDLIILPIKTKYNIKSAISNFLQEKHPDKVILICEDRGGKVRISLRTMREMDFPEIIRKSLKGIGGTGGGHSKAAGLTLPNGTLDQFLDNFKRELKAYFSETATGTP